MNYNIMEIQAHDIEVFGNKGDIDRNKRVLLIGLGGTGTDTLLITKNAIINRFKLNAGKVPENIEFLAIDTDQSILDKRVGSATIPSSDFLLLNDSMIQTNLNDKDKLPEFYKNWVNPSLNAPDGAGTKGAGAIRQIGRYLLISNFKKVYEKITSKIQKIMVAAPAGSLIDVIILSGISGGTGSGTFIDMGYIVRKVLQDLVIGNLQKQITAYLFLPDANEFNPRVPNDAKAFIRVNGYAALKDLDYFMSIPEKKKVSAGGKAKKTYAFRQKYTHNVTIEMEEAPFDSTYLVSGQSNVLNPVPDAYEYAINITADSIVNFIAGSVAEGHTGTQAPGVASVDINGAAMKAQNPHYIMPNGKKLLGIYEYKVIGASMASLPVKDITNYIAGVFLEKIDILKSQLPVQADYDKFYKTVGLAGIEQQVLQKMGTISPGLAGQDLKGNPQNDAVMMKNLNSYLKTAIGTAKSLSELAVKSLESRILKEVDTYFTDLDKGPFFANRIMADGNNGVIKNLTAVAQKLNIRANDCSNEASKAKSEALAKKSEADNAKIGRTTKYNEYINLRVHQTEQMLRSEICKALADKINGGTALGGEVNLVEKIRTKNANLYVTYTKILETLADKFSGGENVVNSSKQGKTFVWDIVSLKDITPTLKAAINQQMLDNQMNNLLNDMIKESEKWCNDKNTLHQFGNFISDGFQQVLSTSMDSYLQSIPAESLNETIATLDRAAQEHFPANIAVTKQAANIYNQVTVPVNAPKMNQLVQNYLSGKGILTPPQKSLLCERISWIRVSIGVPIFRYAYLSKDEAAYKNMETTHKAGLHLYENEGVCGWEYPALFPKTFYENGYVNNDEERRYNRLAALFDRANALGLVRYEHNAASVKVSSRDWCGEQTDIILGKYKIDKNDIYGTIESLSQIMDCKKELGTIAADMDKYADFEYIYLPDSAEEPVFSDTVEYARESFCRMPEAERPLRAEVNKIEGINAVIKEMEDISEAFTKEKDEYMTFVYAFIFNILKRKGVKYIYASEEEDIEVANLMKTKLWRYEIYKKFNDCIREVETENIEKALDEAADSEDELVRVKGELTKVLNSLTVNESTELKKLDSNSPEFEEINNFYNKIKVFTNDEIQKYTNMGI